MCSQSTTSEAENRQPDQLTLEQSETVTEVRLPNRIQVHASVFFCVFERMHVRARMRERRVHVCARVCCVCCAGVRAGVCVCVGTCM